MPAPAPDPLQYLASLPPAESRALFPGIRLPKTRHKLGEVESNADAGRKREKRERPETESFRQTERRARAIAAGFEVANVDDIEEDFRHSWWWPQRIKTLRALQLANMPANRIDRFKNCGALARVKRCDQTGKLKVFGSCCHDRFCRACARARALQIADNLRARIADDEKPYLHIVLTLKHTRTELADQVSRLYTSFKDLRDTKLWKTSVAGGAAFLQTHVSDADGLWHPHLHIIAQARWLDKFELSPAWKAITGDSDNVDVTRVHDADKAIREVSRYAARPVDGDTANNPEKFAELIRSVQGRHLCFTFGTWRGYKITAKPKPDASITWRDLGSLPDIFWNARRGDPGAIALMTELRALSNPAIGPPTLYTTSCAPSGDDVPTLT